MKELVMFAEFMEETRVIEYELRERMSGKVRGYFNTVKEALKEANKIEWNENVIMEITGKEVK